MYYLRIEGNKFGFVVEDIHEILDTDIPIDKMDYDSFFHQQCNGIQFKLKEKPTGNSLFGYIESFEQESIELLPNNSIDKLKENVSNLEATLINVIATTGDMDYRLLELEWALDDAGLTGINLTSTFNLNKKGERIMALSRYEQAKIMILGGVYDKTILTKQLTRYLEKRLVSKEEYNELIALMEAKELVTGE